MIFSVNWCTYCVSCCAINRANRSACLFPMPGNRLNSIMRFSRVFPCSMVCLLSLKMLQVLVVAVLEFRTLRLLVP